MADRQLFVFTVILIGISILFSYSLSSYIVVLFGYSDFHFVIRQAIFGLLSILIMWGLAQLNPNVWLKRIGLAIFIGSLSLMVLMPFLPASIVSEVGGAKRWIKVVGFSLSPVEFFKVGFVYFLAWSFSRKLGHHGNMGIKQEFIRLSPYLVIFAMIMALIAVMQKDLGQVVVLSMTLLSLLIFAGTSGKVFITIMGFAMSMFLIFIMTAEHRIARIKSWWSLAQVQLGPFLPDWLLSKLHVESYSEPYQISHSLNAINNGGIFGVGIGNGTFKLGFLSEVHTDFIFAGLAEEFGFIGVVFVVFIFLWMLQRIFKIANRAEDKSVYLFSIGIGLILSFAFLVNAYGISGITPIKGISVPFLSYGGSVMLGSAFGVGMVLMASNRVNMDNGVQEK